MKTCKQCNKEFEEKRSDAKFCSPSCKAKFWNENSGKNEKIENKENKLHSTLKGVIHTSADVSANGNLPVVTKEIRVETDEYKKLKDQFYTLNADKLLLEKKRKDLYTEYKSIVNEKGGGNKIIGGLAGAAVVNPKLDNVPKLILGGSAGILAVSAIDKLTYNSRLREKQKKIDEIYIRHDELERQYASVCSEMRTINTTMAGIKCYETKVVTIPTPPLSVPELSGNETKTEIRLLNVNTSNDTSLNVSKTNKPSFNESDKIISSLQLASYNYDSLAFKGKWLEFFGEPSINFHCVVHGKPGEGKSTMAIQFAKYLAENFGRVVYISGEEGFSKTIKDKFINNNALMENLKVANLKKYDEIVKEIATDSFHFIFIDSLNNMRIDAEKLKLLRERYKDSALITICQSTKAGQMRGSNEVIHDADIEVIVVNGLATTNKNRFKEKYKELKVF